jgi:hypothetical protein
MNYLTLTSSTRGFQQTFQLGEQAQDTLVNMHTHDPSTWESESGRSQV